MPFARISFKTDCTILPPQLFSGVCSRRASATGMGPTAVRRAASSGRAVPAAAPAAHVPSVGASRGRLPEPGRRPAPRAVPDVPARRHGRAHGQTARTERRPLRREAPVQGSREETGQQKRVSAEKLQELAGTLQGVLARQRLPARVRPGLSEVTRQVPAVAKKVKVG